MRTRAKVKNNKDQSQSACYLPVTSQKPLIHSLSQSAMAAQEKKGKGTSQQPQHPVNHSLQKTCSKYKEGHMIKHMEQEHVKSAKKVEGLSGNRLSPEVKRPCRRSRRYYYHSHATGQFPGTYAHRHRGREEGSALDKMLGTLEGRSKSVEYR